jgi:hypothetical protein
MTTFRETQVADSFILTITFKIVMETGISGRQSLVQQRRDLT